MEELDFCISREYIGFSPAAVDSIYHVFADGDYHIRHLAIPDSLVFVATLGGEGRLLLAEKSFLLHSGEIMIFDASQRPFEYLCTGTNWNFWWFEFRATEPDFPSLPREIVLSLPLEEFHLRMCSEALSSLKLKNSVAASSLLISLLSLLGQKDHGLSNVRGGVGLFQEADRYIRRNLASVTVQSTAMHLGISEHTLLNIFQSLLGIRTVEYIHNMKTDMARHLLISSEKPLREIAWELGYADQFFSAKASGSASEYPPPTTVPQPDLIPEAPGIFSVPLTLGADPAKKIRQGLWTLWTTKGATAPMLRTSYDYCFISRSPI